MAGRPSIGYIGMGAMGSAMAKRLLDAGYAVTIWNRTREKCATLGAKGARVAESPRAVMESCTVTFACTADPSSARTIVFGENGVLAGVSAGKCFVDMSTVDEETAKEIAVAIRARGGRYLEAPVSGSSVPAANGQLVILAAGEEALRKELQPCFDVLGKRTLFLGDVGAGSRMKLVINMVMGINMVALCEGLALGTKSGLRGEDILEVMMDGGIASPMYGLKGPKMLAGDYTPNFALKHEQKDLRLALGAGDQVAQPLPLAAAANESFKAARAAGRGEDDFSAVFDAVRT